ncbi:hypothetical protein [Leptolyngbya ohadii]|uniref:hypothetical protein n=1 Tax=Leptolyngbya ohadii TaxID=1962290 RepID=UPI0015C5E332|nr:hypothetical protein [Leptolyngbya ohadii]
MSSSCTVHRQGKVSVSAYFSSNSVNRLFLVYLSLLRISTNRYLPHLEALWQLAPLPEHYFVPNEPYLYQFRQWAEQLETDAYWLLEDKDFQAAVFLLKNSPPPTAFCKDTGALSESARQDWLQERTRLEVDENPTRWLAAQLRVPLRLSGFRLLIEKATDEEGETYTAWRYALSVNLGTATVPVVIHASRCYGKVTMPLRLKEQQEEIVEQLKQAVPAATPEQLVQEISCLVCFAAQIFDLARRLEMAHSAEEKGRVQDV